MTPECIVRFPELGEYRAVYRPIQNPDKRWISIDDATPPEGEEVLFCCQIDDDFMEVNLGVYRGSHSLGNALVMELSDTVCDDWAPCTHWMHKPATPRLPE